MSPAEKQCYNCLSQESTFYAQENGFTLVKCDGCGLIYMKNLPDASEISEAHKQGLHKGLKELNVTGTFQEGKIQAYIVILNDLYGEFDNSIGS